MRADHPHLILWRLVLETASPLSIGTGRGDGVNDVVLAHDANHLPCLPASSVAGALRNAIHAWQGAKLADALFGYADGQDGAHSRLAISHGHLHGADDRPIRGLTAQISDPLLAPLVARKPVLRQRVRINHRGVADNAGLFDRSVLPAGYRFSLELALWSTMPDAAASVWIDALLASGLRLGGGTRSGLGMLKPVRVHRRAFDMLQAADMAALAALSRHIDDTTGLQHWTLAPMPMGTLHSMTVDLTPEAGFRFGSGHRSLQAVPAAKLASDLPKSERRVVWDGGRGKFTDTWPLVPASSVKGALAHRVAFHANRLAGTWATQDSAKAQSNTQQCSTVRRLFGWAPDDRAEDGGQAGLVWLSDVTLDPGRVVAQDQAHNSIDRFTGGVREHLLFTLENLYATSGAKGPLLRLELVLDLARARQVGLREVDLRALHLALDDLCKGRLALGADSASGIGFFKGSWHADGDIKELAA